MCRQPKSAKPALSSRQTLCKIVKPIEKAINRALLRNNPQCPAPSKSVINRRSQAALENSISSATLSERATQKAPCSINARYAGGAGISRGGVRAPLDIKIKREHPHDGVLRASRGTHINTKRPRKPRPAIMPRRNERSQHHSVSSAFSKRCLTAAAAIFQTLRAADTALIMSASLERARRPAWRMGQIKPWACPISFCCNRSL